MRIPAVFPVVLCIATLSQTFAAPGRELTFADRVAAQRALDRVYYSHQVGARTPFDQAVPPEISERKVMTFIQQSVALKRYWKQSINQEALLEEARRMAQGTRMPGRLAELHSALGDDPVLILECLVRPLLVERMARHLFESDSRFQATARRQAQSLHERLRAGRLSPSSPHSLRKAVEITLQDEHPGDGQLVPAGFSRLEVDAEEFARQRAAAPSKEGSIGPIVEEADAFLIRVLLEEAEDSLRIATYTVPKKSSEEWWRSVERTLDPTRVSTVVDSTAIETAAMLRASGPGAAECQLDVWDNGSLAGSWPTTPHSGQPVWTGTHAIFWGGPGATDKYDPVTDIWTPISSTGAPSSSLGPLVTKAVWTGSEMIVFGAQGGAPFFSNVGGRYNPQTDTWQSISLAGAPQARNGATVVWAGDRMLVSGGFGYVPFGPHIVASTQLSGGSYFPATDTWGPGPAFNRAGHTAVWTGTQLILWGGACGWGPCNLCGNPCASEDYRVGKVFDIAAGTSFNTTPASGPLPSSGYTTVWTGHEMVLWGGLSSTQTSMNTGLRYDPAANVWASTSVTGAPSPRSGHSAIWTGGEMIVWGGGSNNGGRYDPGSDTWVPVSMAGAPAPRSGHAAVWTGDVMVIWGGSDSPSDRATRGRYNPLGNYWIPSYGDPFVPIPRDGHTAVWTGNEMLVWSAGSGERYDPALDTWRAINREGGPASGSAVWTGGEMIVWGGGSNTGGRYDPIGDTWRPTSTQNAPEGRGSHVALWTGAEMIIWGGEVCRPTPSGCFVFDLNTGGGYDPIADTWRTLSTSSAPIPRTRPKGVWTGSRMIVWGGVSRALGSSPVGSGGLYDPGADSWMPVSGVGAPSGRSSHSAVWTGSRMIVWGGVTSLGNENTGGLYDPASDTWSPTTTAGAPAVRNRHSAVWTGGEMIVWGGFPRTQTGGLYNPVADLWENTTLIEAPSARGGHTAVWTGDEMIVWGGTEASNLPTNTGGRYRLGAVSDHDGDGIPACAGDCDDTNPAIYAGAPQVCDGLNNDCLDPGYPGLEGTNEADLDGDGFSVCAGDCDETHASVYPDAPQLCDDLLNNDCHHPAYPSLAGTNEEDDDADGFTECLNDCDDANAGVHPGATDVPGNILDEDCDGTSSCDPSASWDTAGAYMQCVARTCQSLVQGGLLTQQECSEIMRRSGRFHPSDQ